MIIYLKPCISIFVAFWLSTQPNRNWRLTKQLFPNHLIIAESYFGQGKEGRWSCWGKPANILWLTRYISLNLPTMSAHTSFLSRVLATICLNFVYVKITSKLSHFISFWYRQKLPWHPSVANLFGFSNLTYNLCPY